MTKEELENYIPKGKLKGFPKEIITRMLDCQEEQGNKKDISVFENIICASSYFDGFSWNETKEGWNFWNEVTTEKNFDLFFEKYPKKDNLCNSQEFNLENYEPKGQLIDFPKEIIARMLECQVEQGNPRDVSLFEKLIDAGQCIKGFDWDDTQEDWDFWREVIRKKDFNLFFEKYPKQNSQYFKVGDKVFYYITNQIGIIKEIKKHKFDNSIDIVVDFGDNDICEYVVNSDIKRPFLLHYRDDYDYSIIDFNNLPKKQPSKRWRAEKEGVYYYIRFDAKGRSFTDGIRDIHGYYDNDNYNSGNYFRTEIEAEIIAQKLNTYLKRLLKEEHENEKERN